MDKANQPFKNKLSIFAQLLMEQDLILGFEYAMPAILLHHAQEWNDRPDTNEWNWYIGFGYQLWDTIKPKPIYVLARSKLDADDKFYGIIDQELDNINELPCGDSDDYDVIHEDGEIEFQYHSPFNGTPFDFIDALWKEAEARYEARHPEKEL
jgi:hypothetical protein